MAPKVGNMLDIDTMYAIGMPYYVVNNIMYLNIETHTHEVIEKLKHPIIK